MGMRRLSIHCVATTLLTQVACSLLFAGPPLVGPEAVAEADAVGDAELIADVGQLANKSFRSGSGEAQTQLCVQQYVKARVGALELANAKNKLAEQSARTQMEGHYGNCSQFCRGAANTASPYQDIAQKYAARCETGVSDTNLDVQITNLERLVASFREATRPLELFAADREVTAALEELEQDALSSEAIETLAAEVDTLRETNADAITIGRAFFETPEAQANIQRREAHRGDKRGSRNRS